MPVYSFACKKCGEEFTKLVSIKEREQVACPHCGERELKQLFGRFNYVKITQKYNPGCNAVNNCVQAKKYGCGKYAPNPVPVPPS